MSQDPAQLSTAEVQVLSGMTFRQIDYWHRRGLLRPQGGNGGSGSMRRWSEHDALVVTALGQLFRLGIKGGAAERAADALHALAPSEFSGMALVREDGTVTRLLPYDRLDHGWVVNLSDCRHQVQLLLADLVPA